VRAQVVAVEGRPATVAAPRPARRMGVHVMKPEVQTTKLLMRKNEVKSKDAGGDAKQVGCAGGPCRAADGGYQIQVTR